MLLSAGREHEFPKLGDALGHFAPACPLVRTPTGPDHGSPAADGNLCRAASRPISAFVPVSSIGMNHCKHLILSSAATRSESQLRMLRASPGSSYKIELATRGSRQNDVWPVERALAMPKPCRPAEIGRRMRTKVWQPLPLGNFDRAAGMPSASRPTAARPATKLAERGPKLARRRPGLSVKNRTGAGLSCDSRVRLAPWVADRAAGLLQFDPLQSRLILRMAYHAR